MSENSKYDVAVLEEWDEKIRRIASAFGLDWYPQEFELCDHIQMLGYMAYSGMPSHYPHWSFGKAFEKQRTLYDYGVTGLPYELVINSNPALAYLMKDNSLLLQILTIAHVYAHNDFFKNNFTFKTTHAEDTIARFKVHADRIRKYREDPSIGADRVEGILDAAHSLSLQCRRNLAIPKLTRKQEEERLRDKYYGQPEDPYQELHQAVAVDEKSYRKELRKVPIEPDEDILLFIRDYNPRLSEWEKDILTIVHEEAQYFIPQIETKIMNEGWASYWHKRILDSLQLPQELQLEFMVRHNQVLRPPRIGINPYHLGWTIWNAVRLYYDGKMDPKKISPLEQELFEKMERDFQERDAIPTDAGKKAALRRYLKSVRLTGISLSCGHT